MIDFKQAKSQLISVLKVYGFSERADKSCKRYKVYSNGSDVLVVELGANGRYEHYQNKSDSSDYGDTIHFLLKRNLPNYPHGGTIGRREYMILERELSRISVVPIPTTNYHDRQTVEEFRIADYDVRVIDPQQPLSPNVTLLLSDRGIKVDISHSDFSDSVALLRSEKGFSVLLFLWRDEYDAVCGAQYKYIKGNVCVKRFLKNSNRNSSLWRTTTCDKSAIFVTEDPLDALAHRQLHAELNYAYVCTGGSITVTQAIMIRKIAVNSGLPLVLGCDNDIAGQFTNYRICEPAVSIAHDKALGQISIVRDGVETILLAEEFAKFVAEAAAGHGMQVARPESPYKDWHDYLIPKI